MWLPDKSVHSKSKQALFVIIMAAQAVSDGLIDLLVSPSPGQCSSCSSSTPPPTKTRTRRTARRGLVFLREDIKRGKCLWINRARECGQNHDPSSVLNVNIQCTWPVWHILNWFPEHEHMSRMSTIRVLARARPPRRGSSFLLPQKKTNILIECSRRSRILGWFRVVVFEVCQCSRSNGQHNGQFVQMACRQRPCGMAMATRNPEVDVPSLCSVSNQ